MTADASADGIAADWFGPQSRDIVAIGASMSQLGHRMPPFERAHRTLMN